MTDRDARFAAEPLAPEHLPRLVALFDRASCACFCRYWHFSGDKNAWQDRLANHPDDNRRELEGAVASSSDEARGIVALDRASPDRPIVGWLKLAPRASLPKLTRLPVYRGLLDPSHDAHTLTIGCVLVDPSLRREGVARALVRGALQHARAVGAHAVEAHPRRSTEPLHDEEAWQGPERLFVELGFVAVHDVAPYPVYRNVVRAAPGT